MVGEEFCLKNGYIWKKKVDDVQEENQILESKVITIALDGSGSMSGNPWNSVVAGAKSLISYIKTNHLYPQKV
jgi:hypothetical protein